ncbi:N-6 DNA methylase [Muribaculaceae bacterium Isolate-105 (HZI)]|uniref:HsdM family class I SAM-dependent methyltransferase n=1 Tax=Duncaniella muris TaxID=2094150 RepID=UPI000F49E9A8|nr:N-6 DNA methylase [Duncaniella muris]ROT16289.1 N-6 DNA methylase [Muribaculaceae bacterium Isolate-105 (HZI)]ROT20143.1 N-6 DNA methylase [Muribaculaceae bacterium Isolate-114 (HZI)]
MSENNIYHRDIMHYESEIWSCADLLIASGIKQSKFPDYMMPFFALVMLEGRMRNEMRDITESEGIDPKEDIDTFVEAFHDRDCGYNDYIVRQGKTLSNICDNDKTFEQDFADYLAGFDAQLKELLGIERGNADSKYLNLDGMIAELRKKGILMQYITKWAQIDLSPYNNSEITTLEEHIKRKWADISAETAGEQYTPEDIISLIAEIVAAKVDVAKNDFVHLYDPTCGGANLLFGVADRLKLDSGYQYVATYGQDFNDALYALAKIESLFRENSEIRYGNTLTQGQFRDKEFDVVVANPPYGIPWKGYEKEVRDDQTDQFKFYPSVSDGQLLFLQHNAHHLHKDSGIVVEVNNGSSLFSGDAGSGESNIRKYLFDQDWVEAIVQMPSDEFFNTGIVTYLWILNKNKSAERKDKVILINASDLWQPLKKNKGSKRKEMNETHRAAIVRALVEFKDCDIAKVYDKWHFYFNKQQIELTEIDAQGRSASETLGYYGEPVKIKDEITYLYGNSDWRWPKDIESGEGERKLILLESYGVTDTFCVLMCKDCIYWIDRAKKSVVKSNYKGNHEYFGAGKIVANISFNKKRMTDTISAKICNDTYKDTEIILYNPDPEQNGAAILAFMQRYITKPYQLLENTVGVEVNFNKEFYVPETVEPVETILTEIVEIDRELANLQNDLGL